MSKGKYKNKNNNRNGQPPTGTAANAAAPVGAVAQTSDAAKDAAGAQGEFTVFTAEGELRRPETDRSYARGRHEDFVNFADLARAEDELQRAKEEAGIVEPGPWWKRLINRYYDWKDHRDRHLVNKKAYLILNGFFGWCGFHRFYERRWLLGLFYLALCWTGLPAILCVTDFLIVLPMKADENGRVLV